MRFLHLEYSWRLLLCTLTYTIRAQDQLSQADSLASEAGTILTALTAEVNSLYTELASLVETSTTSTAERTFTPSSTSRFHPTSSVSTQPLSLSATSQESSASSMAVSSYAISRSSTNTAAAASASTTPGTAGQDSDNNYLILVIVGSVLGAVIIGLLILITLLCCHRRRKQRNGGVTPTNEENESWRSRPETTSYGPLTQFNQRAPLREHQNLPSSAQPMVQDSKQGYPVIPVPPPWRHGVPVDTKALRQSSIHPAYRAHNGQDLQETRVKSDSTKGFALGTDSTISDTAATQRIDRTSEGRNESVELPTTLSPKQQRRKIPRKPVVTTTPNDEMSAEASLLQNRRSIDGRRSFESSHLVSPIDPDPTELPPLPIGRRAPNMHNSSREALLADDRNQALGAARSDMRDKKSLKIDVPSQQSHSLYQAYQPGVSASPHGPSFPVAAHHSNVQDAAVNPAQTPKHSSFKTVDSDHYRTSLGASNDSDSGNIPVMWRISTGEPRLPPKGVTYHDFVPIKRDARIKGAAPAATRAVRNKENVRRVSLNDLVEAERRKEEDRRRYTSGQYQDVKPAYSEYIVGQAL